MLHHTSNNFARPIFCIHGRPKNQSRGPSLTVSLPFHLFISFSFIIKYLCFTISCSNKSCFLNVSIAETSCLYTSRASRFGPRSLRTTRVWIVEPLKNRRIRSGRLIVRDMSRTSPRASGPRQARIRLGSYSSWRHGNRKGETEDSPHPLYSSATFATDLSRVSSKVASD